MKKHFVLLFIKIFALALPIIDAMSYFFKDNITSVPLMLKALFFILLFIYTFVYYRGNKLFEFIRVILGLCFFVLVYLIFNAKTDLVIEFISMAKLLFFPVFLILLYAIKEMEDEWFDWNIISNIGLIYSIIIIISVILGMNINTFDGSDIMFGSKGVYSAGNDTAIIIGIAISISMLSNFNLKNFAKIIIMLIAIAIMGVKAPLLMLFITLIFILIKNIKNNIYVKQTLIVVGCITIFFLIYIPKSNVAKNLHTRVDFVYEQGIYDVDSVEEVLSDPYIVANEFVLSGRLTLLDEINDVYAQSNVVHHTFGIGYSPYERNTEMDLFDTFYRIGIVGFIIYLLTLIYAIRLHLKNNYLSDKTFILFVTLVCAVMSGHVLTSISVSLVLALVLSSVRNEK